LGGFSRAVETEIGLVPNSVNTDYGIPVINRAATDLFVDRSIARRGAMKGDTREKIESLLDRYEDKLEKARKVAEKKKVEEAKFITEFKRIRGEIIRPAMEEIGKLLSDRDHDAKIFEEDESSEYEGPTTASSIEMRFYPFGYEKATFRRENTPFISFNVSTTFAKKVRVRGSNMLPGASGSSGPRGEHEMGQINEDLVEGEVMAIIEEILSK